MRTVVEIYETYRIMPQLQLHQLRVAAVAQTVCNSLKISVNSQDVILACLFHDMANIIKSDFDHFPDSFRGPQPRSYWDGIKSEYIEKYGSNTHAAALIIAKELSLPDSVRKLIDEISFSRLEITRDSGSPAQKITEYADLRVGPHGVLSLADRIADIRVRYAGKPGSETPDDADRFNMLAQAAHGIEQQLFEFTGIKPEDINDESVAPIIEELRKYQV